MKDSNFGKFGMIKKQKFWEQYFVPELLGKIGLPLEEAKTNEMIPKHVQATAYFLVYTFQNCARCKKDLKNNKDNSLYAFGAKICSDICPWTLSVPRSSQFSSSYALGKLFASRGQIS